MRPVNEASDRGALAAAGRPCNLPTSIRAELREPSMGRIDDVTVAAYIIWPPDHATLPNLKGSQNYGAMYGPPSPLAFRFEPRP